MENLFFIRFLVSSIVLSALILLMIGVKRVFQRHISVKWQYNMWMIFLMMLVLPFIPQKFFYFGRLSEWRWHTNTLDQNKLAYINLLNNGEETLLHGAGGVGDFALSVDYSIMVYLSLMGIGIWMTGVIVWSIKMIRTNYDIRNIKCSAKPIRNEVIKQLFEQCKNELQITSDLRLYESCGVQVPMVCGVRKTYIMLPTQVMSVLSLEDVRYILLHELTHYKNKDILINYVMCIFQIIYWFNPFVHLGLKMMRTDREIACDIEVIKLLDEENYFDYGSTIINFAEILAKPSHLTMMTSMGGTKKQIQKRIEQIAYFKKETRLIKIKSLGIFLLVGAITLSQAPVLSIMAMDRKQYTFENRAVIYEDLSSYFKGIEGSFVLYNLESEQYTIYNKDKSLERVSPNSTYKIYSALIALESGVLQEDQLELEWNGEQYTYTEWNKQQDLYSAIKYSVNWYFQELDQAVGRERLQFYFEQIGYGNQNLTGGIERYWLESSLVISPVEQVELLTDLYTYNSIFKKEHINLLKEVLKLSTKNGATLSGKTGTGVVNDKGVNGWFIGTVEQEGQTYIFATNIEDKDNVSGSLAKEITLAILANKNIY